MLCDIISKLGKRKWIFSKFIHSFFKSIIIIFQLIFKDYSNNSKKLTFTHCNGYCFFFFGIAKLYISIADQALLHFLACTPCLFCSCSNFPNLPDECHSHIGAPACAASSTQPEVTVPPYMVDQDWSIKTRSPLSCQW